MIKEMRALLLLLLVGGMWGQQTEPPPEIEFRAGATQVSLDVSVLDKTGRPVTELSAQDFVVLDEGKPAAVAYAGGSRDALDVALLLDVSGSMKQFLRDLAASARTGLENLRPEDRVAVLSFGRGVMLEEDLTGNRAVAARALQVLASAETEGGGTNINPAILETAKYLNENRGEKSGRRVILILTDNYATHYKAPDREVIEALQKSGIVLVSLVVGNRPQLKNRPDAANPDFTFADVFSISEQTGGEAIRTKNVAADFTRMMERIRFRYLLQFAPGEGPAGTFRRLNVQLSREAQKKYPGVRVLARTGYYIN